MARRRRRPHRVLRAVRGVCFLVAFLRLVRPHRVLSGFRGGLASRTNGGGCPRVPGLVSRRTVRPCEGGTLYKSGGGSRTMRTVGRETAGKCDAEDASGRTVCVMEAYAALSPGNLLFSFFLSLQNGFLEQWRKQC